MYVPIPKVATNSLRLTFPKWRAEDHKNGIDIPGFALIRDPVARWFSGIKEATFHGDKDREWDLMLGKARSEGTFVWDNHTRPQSEFLNGFDVELVKLDNAGPYLFKRFGRKLEWERMRFWQPAPDLIPLIREFYADDVELYEKAV